MLSLTLVYAYICNGVTSMSPISLRIASAPGSRRLTLSPGILRDTQGAYLGKTRGFVDNHRLILTMLPLVARPYITNELSYYDSPIKNNNKNPKLYPQLPRLPCPSWVNSLKIEISKFNSYNPTDNIIRGLLQWQGI